MTIAYSYFRYSSAGQKDGDSIRRQLELANDWAALHPEITLDTTLRDEGVSGSTGENRVKGALSSFLKSIEQGRIAPNSYLLIEQFDRLTRESEVIAINLLTGILMKKVKVVTLIDGTVLDETADAMDLMRAVISLSQGHQENKKRTARVAKAWAQKKVRARETGEVLTRKGPAWCAFNETTKRFDGIPDRVEIIRGIFRDYLDGKGASIISQELNARPVKPFTTSSKGWHPGYILTILKTRSVMGYYQPTWWSKTVGERAVRDNDGEDIPGYYPEIIDEQTFARAQHQIEKRSKHGRQGRGKRAKTTPNVIIGLGRCEECGGTLVLGNAPNKARSRFFRCYDSSRKHHCQNKTRYYQTEVLACLEGILAQAHMADVQPDAPAHQVTALNARMAELQRKKSALLDMLEEGVPGVVERLKDREEEIRSLAKLIVDAKAKETQSRHLERGDAMANAIVFLMDLDRLQGQALYDARAKANALLVEALDWVMPTARGVYAGQGQRLFYYERDIMMEPLTLPVGTPIVRAALDEIRGPLISDEEWEAIEGRMAA